MTKGRIHDPPPSFTSLSSRVCQWYIRPQRCRKTDGPVGNDAVRARSPRVPPDNAEAIDRLLDTLASVVTRQRLPVLVVIVALAAAFSLRIPEIQADFTPSDLFAKFEDQEAVAAEFREEFGNTDNVLLVLVHAPDVLDREVLQFTHDITRALANEDYAARVDAITVLPIPREPDDDDRDRADESVLSGLYITGSTVSTQLSRIAASMRGVEPRLDGEAATRVPDVVINLALGTGTVRPAIDGDQVTDDEARILRDALRGSRLIEGRLISRDGTLTAIAVSLSDHLTRNADVAGVIARVESQLASRPPPEGVETLLGGLPYVRSDVIAKMRADQSVMLPLSLMVCILILFASFRWLPAMVLPTGAVVIAALILVGGMSAIGESFNILNNIVPLLIIIIGISNSIHLVSRYGEEIRAGRDREEATREAVKRMAVACFLTSFTTAVGFGSLVVSRTEVLGRFGITAAIGVLIAYVVTLTFLPAALMYVRPPRTHSGATEEGMLERTIERVTRAILHRPLPVLGVALLIFAGALRIATGIQIDSAVLDQFSPSDPIYQTTRLIEDKLSGVRPLEVYLTSATEGRFDDPAVLNAMDEIQAWAMTQEGVLDAISYVDFLHEIEAIRGGADARDAPFESRSRVETSAALLAAGERNPLSPYVSTDRRSARVNIGVRDFGAQGTIRLAEALEGELAESFGEFPDIEFRLTGDAYVGSKGLDAVISDLLESLALAVFIIFGFMTLLFRSARLAALSVPPNVLPLIGTMAFMVLMDVPLNAATAIIFSISIGLAVDGSIHVLARFREEVQRTKDVDEALVSAARGTGKAILMTCLSLMFGFGVMLSSSFVPVRRFGELIAITIAGCLLATVIVLPALLKVGWLGPDALPEED